MEASSIASSLFPPTLLCRLSTEAMLGTPKAGVQWGFTTVSMHTCSGTQLFLTLCDPMACSPPGSSVHGIFLTRILEWVAISFSKQGTASLQKMKAIATQSLTTLQRMKEHCSSGNNESLVEK